MNNALFKATLKSNWLVMLIIFLILTMYVSIIIGMFDPESASSINELMKLLPHELISAMGFGGLSTDLTNFLFNFLYGFIYIIFPLIYIVIIANNMVAKHVDNGSMVYLLSTPNSRIKIITTQAIFLISSLILI